MWITVWTLHQFGEVIAQKNITKNIFEIFSYG